MATTPEPQRLVNAQAVLSELFGTSTSTKRSSYCRPTSCTRFRGTIRLSGVFHGPDEVRRHIVKLIDFSRGTFEVLKWMDWMIGDTYIAVLQYAQAQTHGRIYRGHHLYLLEFDPNDLLSVIKVFFEDQAAADRFFAYES